MIVKKNFFWEWSLSSSSSLKRWRRKEDLVSSWPRLSHSCSSWPWPSRRPAPLKQVRLYLHRDTCDQIGRFIGLWATFSSLWQQLICPNLPHSKAIFVKVSKFIIFLVKSFWATFIDIWRFFSGLNDRDTYTTRMLSRPWSTYLMHNKYTSFLPMFVPGHSSAQNPIEASEAAYLWATWTFVLLFNWNLFLAFCGFLIHIPAAFIATTNANVFIT